MAFEPIPGGRGRRGAAEEKEEPLPSSFDPVTFVGGAEEIKPASVAAMHVQQAQAAANAKPVKVKVKAPFRVVHDATVYIGGDTAQVPPEVADAWIAKHWAQPATTRVTTKEK
jgi:hypothetical protein